MSDHSKTVPLFHGVRISRDGLLPEPVHFILPNLGAERTVSNRRPGYIYLEDYFPTGAEHHAVLGQFLDSWGHAEQAIQYLFCSITEMEFRRGSRLCNAMSPRGIQDALYSLGTMVLNDQGIDHLTDALDRFKLINAKRNIIVHGTWTLEVAVWRKQQETKFKVRLLREVQPQDHRKNQDLSDLRNQKERLRHCFDLKRIAATSVEVMQLGTTIQGFCGQLHTYWKIERNIWKLSKFFEQLRLSIDPAL